MAEQTSSESKDDAPEITPFDPTKKKKKKKVVIQDIGKDDDHLSEKIDNLSLADGVENAFVGGADHVGEDEEDAKNSGPTYPWEGTDRDYYYEELLSRVFHILRENNPELAGDRRRTVIRPPQVLREGTKKTVFVNFMDLCRTMHRQPDHVMTFLLAEMGTSGSLDGQQRLVVKGRFAPKNFEGILRRYINEYVICNGCRSPDTILSKENRLFFLRCEQCGSGRSVAPIKTGFVARVGRRKAGLSRTTYFAVAGAVVTILNEGVATDPSRQESAHSDSDDHNDAPQKCYVELSKLVKENLGPIDPYFEKLAGEMVCMD
ncbi:hypothetical protein L1987_66875 [Smallanthus sonchifolius]|uniref:Uncharacterized protein n=1 Tax=Smallanthus sonchifolius TaxID=185202 RepID=A0ACB9BYB4_9ASTR|nr:hypothetical protein L1987_66875 [Smallanthus sonchifolius]